MSLLLWYSRPRADIVGPTVEVTAPNGAEMWDVDSVHNITWLAEDPAGITTIDLYFSINGSGGDYTLIASGESNDGRYAWTLPDVASSNCFVKVVAWDAIGTSGNDVSNAAFEIAPVGTYLSPMGTPIGMI